MKVSLVIPVYNEEKFIGNCLNSVFNQTIIPDEVIIVDNNSTDNTIDIASQFPVKIVKERKQGMIPARNCGFENAKYEIIAKTDADTVFPKNWIEKIKEQFVDGVVAVGGPVYYSDALIKGKFLDTVFDIYFDVTSLMFGRTILTGANYAILKTAWQELKDKTILDDSKVHEDMDISYKMSDLGQVKWVDELGVYSSARRVEKRFLSWATDYPLRVMKTYYYLKIKK